MGYLLKVNLLLASRPRSDRQFHNCSAKRMATRRGRGFPKGNSCMTWSQPQQRESKKKRGADYVKVLNMTISNSQATPSPSAMDSERQTTKPTKKHPSALTPPNGGIGFSSAGNLSAFRRCYNKLLPLTI